VRTSIVSRSWKPLWRFNSNNVFFVAPMIWIMIDEYDGIDEQPIGDFIKIKRDKFIEDVNWVTQLHNGVGINKFNIRCDLHKKDFDHLDMWISFAASFK
jgi:hypothetical protein